MDLSHKSIKHVYDNLRKDDKNSIWNYDFHISQQLALLDLDIVSYEIMSMMCLKYKKGEQRYIVDGECNKLKEPKKLKMKN